MNIMYIGLHTPLRPGAEVAYEHAHQHMPNEVIDALRKAGIHKWIIFRSGHDLFHVIECEDYQHAMKQFLANSHGNRWHMEMATLFEPVKTSDESRIRQPMDVIWSL